MFFYSFSVFFFLYTLLLLR